MELSETEFNYKLQWVLGYIEGKLRILIEKVKSYGTKLLG